jgi:Transposase DDE domain/Transposase domain (DUF772)
MQSTLRERLDQFSHLSQSVLFERLERQVGALSEKARLLVSVLGMISLSRYVAPSRGWRGRPSKDRRALAAAFLAKAILGLETTRQLLERLKTDPQLRCLCGWHTAGQLPHEATFSRAFAEFANSELPQQLHEALIQDTQQNRLIGHIARDSTAIEARERFDELPAHKPIVKRKRGRPLKAELALSGRRLPRQRRQTLAEMLTELPRHCSLGVKKSSKGYQQYWRGYKLHLDVADGQIPIACLLTAASLHDSQVAIPLATLTAQRVTSLYDLMDCAYDANQIHEHSRSLGHVPLIALGKSARPITHRTYQDSLRRYDKRRVLPRSLSRKRPPFTPAQEQRFHLRTMSERVNARLKDEFGGRTLRVRGATKIMAHLMFGILALTVDQLLRLAG